MSDDPAQFSEVMSDYRDAFGDSPPVSWALSGAADPEAMERKIAEIARKAIDDGEALSEAEWYERLGIEPPPGDALV